MPKTEILFSPSDLDSPGSFAEKLNEAFRQLRQSMERNEFSQTKVSVPAKSSSIGVDMLHEFEDFEIRADLFDPDNPTLVIRLNDGNRVRLFETSSLIEITE